MTSILFFFIPNNSLVSVGDVLRVNTSFLFRSPFKVLLHIHEKFSSGLFTMLVFVFNLAHKSYRKK